VAVRGKNVTLKCHSKSPPRWTKYQGPVKSDALLHDNILFLYNMREEDRGVYICEGTADDGTEFRASAVVLVGG